MKTKQIKKWAYRALIILGLLSLVLIMNSCKKEEVKPSNNQTNQNPSPINTKRQVNVQVYTRDTLTNLTKAGSTFIYAQIWTDSIGYQRHYKVNEYINSNVGDTINLLAGLAIDPYMTNKTKYVIYKFYSGGSLIEHDSVNFLLPGDSYLRRKLVIK